MIVADPADPILPLAARAELVAALDCVAYVIPAGATFLRFLMRSMSASRMLSRGQVFARHVLARHNTR